MWNRKWSYIYLGNYLVSIDGVLLWPSMYEFTIGFVFFKVDEF